MEGRCREVDCEGGIGDISIKNRRNSCSKCVMNNGKISYGKGARWISNIFKEEHDMGKAVKAKQIRFSLPSKIGLLSEVSSLITAGKINIEAICAYEMSEQGFFMLLTDNHAKTKKILSHMGAEVSLDDIITVELPNKVGELRKVAKKISDAGIDINFIYGSPVKGKMTLILKTANDKKALTVLNK